MVKHTTHYIVVETSDSYSDERSAMVVAACLICGIFDSRTRVTHGIFWEYIPVLLRRNTQGGHSAIFLAFTYMRNRGLKFIRHSIKTKARHFAIFLVLMACLSRQLRF